MSKNKTASGPWVKLKTEWNGHQAGERVQIEEDKVLQSLVAEGKAKECSNPAKKLLNKALAEMKDGLATQVKETMDQALKAIRDERAQQQRTAPPFIRSLAELNDRQAGQVVDANHGGLQFKGYTPDGYPIQGLAPGIGTMSGVGMGKFLQAVYKCGVAPTEQAEAELLKEFGSQLSTKTALAEGQGDTGGYTVPLTFAMNLLQLAVQNSIVRPRAFIQPMAARELRIPMLDVTKTTASGNNFTNFLGGVQVNWSEEATSKPEYEPSFKQLGLVAHELSAYTLASNQLLADSAIGLDAFLSTIFSRAIGWAQDYAFLQGLGSGQPLGVINAPATITSNRAGAHGTFAYGDAVTMLSKLLTTSMGSAVWIMSQTQIPNLYQIQDGASRNIIMPNPQSPGGGAAQTPPMTLLGLPIIFSEKLPAKSASNSVTGDVLLCDFSYYVIGDRMSLEFMSSIHAAFRNAQTAWRAIARVDGQPWLDNVVTLADNATTVSPFVALGN